MMFFNTLLVAAMSSMAAAKLGLEPMPSTLTSGEIVNVTYWADQEYRIQMELVMKDGEDGDWESYDTILKYPHEHPGNHTFEWQVREVYQGRQYGVWLSGDDLPLPKDGRSFTGYAALSNWFEIEEDPNKPSRSNGMVVGHVAKGLAIFAFVGGAIFALVRRRRRSQRACRLPQVEEWRQSTDRVSMEKERARVAMGEVEA